MSLSDQELLELHELCNAVADHSISPADHARLSEWLRNSEEARRIYIRSMALSASLFHYAGEMMAEAPDAPKPSRFQRILRPAVWWIAAPLAAAAVLVLAFWLSANRSGDGTGNSAFSEAEADETVAHLSGAKDCRWSGASLALGDELRPGQQLELTQGAAEITFDSGAQVVVEAPASLEVASAWNAVLRRGTIKANVPAQAVGFRIANSAVDVVDLGTEFSMVTEDNGETEVFVLKGAVETNAPEGEAAPHKRMVLREKQARRFARTGISDVRDREQKLARLSRKPFLDRTANPIGYAHWSFDDLTSGSLTARTSGLPGGKYQLQADSAGFLSAASTPGKWGKALHFDGSATLKTNFPALSRRAAHTIAFWTRIPAETQLSDAGPAVAWTVGGKEPRPFDIAWNRNPAQGAFGALQTQFGKRLIVGTTLLRDGQWHHVAVVLTPAKKNETGMQAKFYADGRLDGISAKFGTKRHQPGARREELPALADDVLALGGLSGSNERFHGDIDELYVCDGVLAPREINHLMMKNQMLATSTPSGDPL